MRNLDLMIHAGSYKTTLEEVEKVQTPEPKGRWHPISHIALYNQVRTALHSLDMTVVNEQHALGNGGDRYFSLLQVARNRTIEIPGDDASPTEEDIAYVIGLRNAHDKRFNAGLAVGAGVFVCDNLSFNGEITLGRKHTTFINRDLPVLTARAVGMLADKWTNMTQRFDIYKETEVSDAQAHDLMIRGLDTGACTTTQIPAILKEWRTPRHPEFATGKTGWRLFNAFTEIAKSTSVFSLPKRTQSLHALIDSHCGLLGKHANN